jgi:hypothetical protein
MKNMKQNHRTILILITAILILACMPTLGPASTPIPTFDANAPLTAIVLTAGAAATQTALHSPPTATPTVPTNTPFPTPTATATFLFFIPTSVLPPTQIPLGSSDKEFDCQVLSADPRNPLPVSTKFIAKWVVANIGKSTWDGGSADYRYIDGEKIHLQSIYDFPVSVPPSATVELTVDMQAPPTPGKYSTFWIIFIGKNAFCKMQLDLVVN